MLLLKGCDRVIRMQINIAASHLYYHEPHFNYEPSRVNYEHAILSPDLPTNTLNISFYHKCNLGAKSIAFKVYS